MVTSSAVPLCIVGTFVLMCSAQVWNKWRREQDRMRRRVALGDIVKRYLIVCIAILSLVLTSICAKIFKIFDCFDVDPNQEAGDGKLHQFLRIDTAVDCSSPEYKLGLSWAYLMIMVYPIAVPSLFFYLLWVNRVEIFGRGLRSRAMGLNDEAVDKATEAEKTDAWRKAEILRRKYEKLNTSGGGVVEGLTFLYEQYHPELCFW